MRTLGKVLVTVTTVMAVVAAPAAASPGRSDDGLQQRLDDPVGRWLPGVVPDGDRITVRHLLNHTSGLYDFRLTIPLPPSQEFLDNRWRTWTAAEQIQRAVTHPPTTEPPGEVLGYSNTNYLVLGEIIEKVTGHSYGTVEDGEGLRLVDFTELNPTLFGAGGELISTAGDLQAG